ncbi:hypothetical protein BDW69DRAFT_187683 [Aspergillus filifer]
MSSEGHPTSTEAPGSHPLKGANGEGIKRQIENMIEYSDPCTFEIGPPKSDDLRYRKPPRSRDASRLNAGSPTVWVSAILMLFIVGILCFSSEGLSISKLVVGVGLVGIVSYGSSRWYMSTRSKRSSSKKKNSWF